MFEGSPLLCGEEEGEEKHSRALPLSLTGEVYVHLIHRLITQGFTLHEMVIDVTPGVS